MVSTSPRPALLGPREFYKRALVAHQIQPDMDQARAIDRLQLLHEQLIDYAAVGRHALSRFWRNLRDHKAPQSLYLYGDVGRGKSMLMDIFVETSPLPLHTRRIHFHDFMQEIHDALHAQSQKSRVADALVPIARNFAKSTWILCLDEFFVNNIADAMILGRLFEAFFDEGIIIVTTSNRHPDDLYKNGLQRDRFEPTITLIKQHFDLIGLNGDTDYRTQNNANLPHYLYPLNEKRHQDLSVIFSALTGSEAPKKKTLRVKGHALEIPRFAKRIAWADFKDLCAKDYGTVDYLALAKQIDALILENIPQLGTDDYNEAIRFTLLIDTLYDSKVAFYCSAAVAPDKLYLSGHGAFEFARTLSRLQEMQSPSWGK